MSSQLFLLLALALLHVAVALVLIRKYLDTRDDGFIWLGIAIVILPIASALLSAGQQVAIDHLVHRHPIALYPFSLVASGQMTIGTLISQLTLIKQLIGVGLLLVAVVRHSASQRETRVSLKI